MTLSQEQHKSEREALLPCPFCGNESPSFERLGTHRQSCIVICGNCGARHESGDEDEKCGSSWNCRASMLRPIPEVEGWRLVPVHPTVEMRTAGSRGIADSGASPVGLWAAMLEAAPSPPSNVEPT